MVDAPATTRVNSRGLLALVAILSPALVWILLNRAPLSGDEAVYGRASADLFRTLIGSPIDWLHQALTVLPSKPNALVWVGQFFVPMGHLLGSVDTGLLLSVWFAQLCAVMLLYVAILHFSAQDTWTAFLGSLLTVSAPIWIWLGGYYMVESIQTMAVAWFVLIMACADRWSRAYTLCHLLAAAAFATLTKTTTPLFCVWPALLSLGLLAARRKPGAAWGWREPGVVAMAILSLLLSAIAATWYYRNWTPVIAHLRAASTGPVAAAWGKEDTFLNTLAFWLQESARGFFLAPAIALPVLVLLIAIAGGLTSRSARFDRAMLVAVLQVATVLCVFGFSANRSTRYLLPLAPYLGLIVSWSVHRIGRRDVRTLIFGAAALQMAAVHAIAFGLAPNRSNAPLRGLDRDGKQAGLLEAMVTRTCSDQTSARYLSVVAIDPNFRGDWLAPEPASYVAERNLLKPSARPPCHFGYAGGNFFGSSAAEAWNMMVADPVRYVITIDPTVHAAPTIVYNRALDPKSLQILWTNLTTTGLFDREPPLPEDSGIAIFRRLDLLGTGRALSDRGLHEEAIKILKTVTGRAPTNVEAWANLALAYERGGLWGDAITAGDRALSLNPKHYYVNLGLARALLENRDWTKGIARAEAAAADAPGAPERASALMLAARGAFRAGDTVRGCDFLRTAGDPQKDPEIRNQMSTNGCGR